MAQECEPQGAAVVRSKFVWHAGIRPVCEQTGAQPYFAANLRSLPAQQLYQWLEYCNAPAGTTTFADLRANDGHAAPMGVKYWGVGNESWGCGGEFDPEDYASELRRYAAWMPKYGVDLRVIGSGLNDDEFSWTRRCFSKLTLNFDAQQSYSILRSADEVEGIIQGHWDVMAEHDPQHRVKLVVDEWGAWYAPGTEPFAEALLG